MIFLLAALEALAFLVKVMPAAAVVLASLAVTCLPEQVVEAPAVLELRAPQAVAEPEGLGERSQFRGRRFSTPGVAVAELKTLEGTGFQVAVQVLVVAVKAGSTLQVRTVYKELVAVEVVRGLLKIVAAVVGMASSS